LLTSDMKRVVEEQRLGFVATVSADGTPDLSPTETVAAWDLVFADISSPLTVENLKARPAIEINIIDPVVRKGYSFKGMATVHASGPTYDEVVAFFRRRGVVSSIRAVLMVAVESARPLTSPAYDLGLSEAELSRRWESHWSEIRSRRLAKTATEKARR
jgi:predicted pyridoxine 5'-phosphate oxidase superfamily flavin-nucleotide-binding protein